MVATRTCRPASMPSIAGPDAMGRRVSGSTRARWRKHRQEVTIRHTAATGATTDKPRPFRRVCAWALNVTGSEEAMMASALSSKERSLMDAYWRAANYLSVGQIYLYDNPLLKQSLTKD